jgi:hypothetical protein
MLLGYLLRSLYQRSVALSVSLSRAAAERAVSSAVAEDALLRKVDNLINLFVPPAYYSSAYLIQNSCDNGLRIRKKKKCTLAGESTEVSLCPAPVNRSGSPGGRAMA